MKKIACVLTLLCLMFCLSSCNNITNRNESSFYTYTDSYMNVSENCYSDSYLHDTATDIFWLESPSPSLTYFPSTPDYVDRLPDDMKANRLRQNDCVKKVYDRMLPYVLTYTNFSIALDDMVHKEQVYFNAAEAIRQDYPETWMYFSSGYHIITESYGSKYYNLYEQHTKHFKSFDAVATDAYINKVYSRCDEILSQMPEKLSTKEKYIWIADKLIEITECADTLDYTYADGPLLYGKGVCQAYSMAYQLLCQKAGLWCILCSGMSGDVGHCWNVVKLDNGATYYMDLTWADSSSNKKYYFMTYEECIATGHKLDKGEWIANGK